MVRLLLLAFIAIHAIHFASFLIANSFVTDMKKITNYRYQTSTAYVKNCLHFSTQCTSNFSCRFFVLCTKILNLWIIIQLVSTSWFVRNLRFFRFWSSFMRFYADCWCVFAVYTQLWFYKHRINAVAIAGWYGSLLFVLILIRGTSVWDFSMQCRWF